MKIELPIPTSWTNIAGFLGANSSRVAIDGELGIRFDKEAKTLPPEFRMTSPILASPESSKTAPSKWYFLSGQSDIFYVMDIQSEENPNQR